MTREMFLKVATAALRLSVGRTPEEQAEAIAYRMDIVAEALGDTPPLSQVLPPPIARAAFPNINPEAITPVAPEFHLAEPDPGGPALIQPATSIPDPKTIERVSPAPAQSLRSLRPPTPVQSLPSLRPPARMKVEDLSALLQERTPSTLSFDVPMEDGTSRRVTYQRNVISMHALDSVQLVYSPPNTAPSAREASEVQIALHVDDVPFDLPAILKRLTAMAVDRLRPRAQIIPVPPQRPSGPVVPSSDVNKYSDVQAAFNSQG
jgi:hypothetical protein